MSLNIKLFDLHYRHIFKSWDRLHTEDEQQYSPLVQVVKLKIQRVRVVRVVKLCEWFK